MYAVSAPAPRPPEGLARAAGVTGAATLASRILGVVREQVLASLFGASDAMDAFNVAFRVPNMVRDLFAEGAMSAAFVPTFTKTLATDGREAAWRGADKRHRNMVNKARRLGALPRPAKRRPRKRRIKSGTTSGLMK